MNWQEQLHGNPIDWLLEPDDPGVRYLALRNLLELSNDDPVLVSAREQAHRQGPIAAVLNAMHEDGYWVQPGPGYLPKYRSTVWSIILLGQLGASVDMDERIHRACQYLLAHAFTEYGQFTMTGVPSGTLDCLQGNLCSALLDLGCQEARLDRAFEWMARSVIGAGIAPLEDKKAELRYYAGKCGPRFACGANGKLPCAWGAVKVMLALGKLPPARRTPLVEEAIQQGVDFLFGVDPAEAAYPHGDSEKPSRNWWKFGFPVFYVTDILQIVEALVRLGYADDRRLSNALDLIRMKQDVNGRWALEYDYIGKTWVDFGIKKQPNQWVTLRALWVLRHASQSGYRSAIPAPR